MQVAVDRVLPARERKPGDRGGDADVDAEHPGLGAVAVGARGGARAGEDRAGVAVARAVGELERRIEVVGADDRQQRTEELLASELRLEVRGRDDRRADQRAPRAGVAAAVEDNLVLAVGSAGDRRVDAVARVRADQWADLDPLLVAGPDTESDLAREELFGPLLTVVRASDLDGALEFVNGSRYGNAGSIFTTSGRAARDYRFGIEAGMLGVNVGVPAPVAWFPFSGWKDSLDGDLHANGTDAVDFYTRKKVVTARW